MTSPSSTHTAEDGEIDQSDAVIEAGTFSARRNTIGGWANWGEATTAEYSNLVGSDNLYYQGADPGAGDNAAMIFEFTVAEDPSCITQIDVNVEAAQGGTPGADRLFVYLWNYTTNSYLVGGSMNGNTDTVISFNVTTNPGDYVQASDGQLTVFVVNEDTSDWIRIDDITLTVSASPTAALSGMVVPSVTEGEIVAGGETLVITLTNDTWDPTVGADNAITTALINGIDSAQAEATGWDAVVKANMDFNDVTRTSDTVVTITLGAEPTYGIRTAETITVTVPATAVASGGPITATPTFQADGYLDSWTTGTTHTVSAGSNRLLLVAVYGEDSGAIASIATVTWGGQTLTPIGEAIVGTGYSNLVWLGYLDEAGIAGGTDSTIVATWSGATPNESVLYAAVTLDDVDQTTPVGDSSTGTATNASTVLPATALNVAVNDVVVYATVSGEQGQQHTPASGYLEGTEEDSGGVGQVAANATKTITAAGTEQPTADWINSNNRLAIVAAVIKPAP